MSERKVLNKYYPADYDPSKIPRAKRPKNRQWTIRTMAPFNMRCNTCGEYIYKGKKFNSRQELAEGETYLGLKVFRFYIKCPRCVSEISFKTDPENVDYAMEAGATRNFEALRTAEQMAEREAKEKEEELANNPMKMLENRTKASQREMDMLETLQDLKDMNKKHATVDTENIIEQYKLYEEKLQQLQDDEDEALVKSVFGKDETIKRIADSDEDSDTSEPIVKKSKLEAATDILVEKPVASCSSTSKSSSTSVNASKKAQNIVKQKSSLLQSKPLLKTLVKTKAKSSSNTEEDTKAPLKDNEKETKAKSNDDKKPLIVGGLSLLGGYSGSSDSD